MNKLMIFGDSIFKGITYNNDRQRYFICENKYEALLSERGIVTENCCKMGATVDKINSILDRKLDSIDNETIVLLEFGGNDSDFDWQYISEAPDDNHLPKTGSADFISLYKNIINKIRQKGAKIIISNIIPIDAEKYMKWISKNRNYDNIMHFLGDISTLYRWQEFYNLTVERIAKEENCPLLDIRDTFLLSRRYKSLLCEDGLHPTLYGHEVIDKAIYNSVLGIA